jgi:hypothetical protein
MEDILSNVKIKTIDEYFKKLGLHNAIPELQVEDNTQQTESPLSEGLLAQLNNVIANTTSNIQQNQAYRPTESPLMGSFNSTNYLQQQLNNLNSPQFPMFTQEGLVNTSPMQSIPMQQWNQAISRGDAISAPTDQAQRERVYQAGKGSVTESPLLPGIPFLDDVIKSSLDSTLQGLRGIVNTVGDTQTGRQIRQALTGYYPGSSPLWPQSDYDLGRQQALQDEYNKMGTVEKFYTDVKQTTGAMLPAFLGAPGVATTIGLAGGRGAQQALDSGQSSTDASVAGLKEAGKTAAFMGVAGGASGALESLGTKLLSKAPEAIKNSLAAEITKRITAGAGGGIAGGIAANQIEQPGTMPDAETMLHDAVFNAIFHGLPGTVKAINESAEVGTGLKDFARAYGNKVTQDFGKLQFELEPTKKTEALRTMVTDADNVINFLSNERFIGQNKNVQDFKEILSFGRENMINEITRIENQRPSLPLPGIGEGQNFIWPENLPQTPSTSSTTSPTQTTTETPVINTPFRLQSSMLPQVSLPEGRNDITKVSESQLSTNLLTPQVDYQTKWAQSLGMQAPYLGTQAPYSGTQAPYLGTTSQFPDNKLPDNQFSRAGNMINNPYNAIAKAVYDHISNALTNGVAMSNNDLFRIADKAFSGTQTEGKYTVKDAHDAMELGVNKFLLDAQLAGINIDSLNKILSTLPTQGRNRTAEMEQFQQFSTPPNIAYIANWVANIKKGDTVLEPSAGVGGLATFAKKFGAKVIVNELSKRRFEILKQLPFDGFYNENAEQINNVLPRDLKPDVVVMNPPFSATAGRMGEKNATAFAKRHLEQALLKLVDGGRLVAIVGQGMADNAPTFRDWWNTIKNKYNVRANVGIDGDNYKKYGTTFGIQLVVIDKNGKTDKTVTGQFKDLKDVMYRLEDIRNERTQQPTTISQQETNIGNKPKDTQESRPDKGVSTSGNGTGIRGQQSTQQPTPTGQSDANIRPTGTTKPGETVSGNDTTVRGTSNAGSDKPIKDTGGKTGSDRVPDREQPSGEFPDRLETEIKTAEPESVKDIIESDDDVYSKYRPKYLRIEGAKPHMTDLVESAAMAAVDPPPINYMPNLPKNLIESGGLTIPQLEAIAYAGQAHQQILSDGKRKGFFIGDGTGVGKGREVAGIILDNFRRGKKKAIWISYNPKLIKDAVRDWAGLGQDPEQVHDIRKFKTDKDITAKDGIVFVSYATLKSGAKNNPLATRLNQLVKWFGKDFDGVIIFDESHNMGNAIDSGTGMNKKKAAKQALAGVDLQNMLPNAKVVYASATGATNVHNLAYLTRLGLWGENPAFHNIEDFISKVSDGGIASMELVARDMKAMGMYLARNLSYKGVEYNTLSHELTPMQQEIYDTLALGWQKILQNMNDVLKDTNANGLAKGRARSQFYSTMQRFFNQIITSMSMPSVITDIKSELAKGNSVVIQLVNTNAAAVDRQISSVEADDMDLEDIDITPTDAMVKYLENAFPVYEYEEYVDDNGNIRTRPVLDSNGQPVVSAEAVRKRDKLIDEVKMMRVPDGPMEILFDTFGPDAVAEVTGRTQRIVNKFNPETNRKERVIEKRNEKSTIADAKAFQNGDKKILVFSDAGGTGESYHADKNAKNQSKRIHYLLQPGWNAFKATQGFGRTHRTNQAVAPLFKLVTTNLMGQKRFTSTIAKRLDMLGALTKGQRQASGSGMFGQRDNLESSIAQASLREFYKTLSTSIIKKMGLGDKLLNEYGRYVEDYVTATDISMFLNRILSLEVDEQNEVFRDFYDMFQKAYDRALENGYVDMGMENYRANKVEFIDEKTIRKDDSGAETKYIQLKAFHKNNIVPFKRVENYMPKFIGIYKVNETGEIKAVYSAGTKTTEAGDVVKVFKLMSPTPKRISNYQESTLDEATTKLPDDEWQDAWENEMSKTPKFSDETLHLLSGTLLPIWNKLPSSNTRVVRVITDEGKQYLGRLITSDNIDSVLRSFNLDRTVEEFKPEDVFNRLMNGEVATLQHDKLKIARRMVSGERRLELIGNNAWFYARKTPMIEERISSKWRFFIPTGENGIDVLKKLLHVNPVIGMHKGIEVEDENLPSYSRKESDIMDDKGGGENDGKARESGLSKQRRDNRNRKSFKRIAREEEKSIRNRVREAQTDVEREIVRIAESNFRRVVKFFTDSKSKIDGLTSYKNPKEIFLNTEAKAGLLATFNHELYHSLVKTNDVEYLNNFKYIVTEIAESKRYEKGRVAFAKMFEKQYREFLLENPKVLANEIIANEFANALLEKNNIDNSKMLKTFLIAEDVTYLRKAFNEFLLDIGDKLPSDTLYNMGLPFYSRNEKQIVKPFFSKLQQTIEEKMPNKAEPNLIYNLIKNAGVKDEEVKWSGLTDFLKGKDRIDKGELLEFLRMNELQIEEKMRAAPYSMLDGYFSDEYKKQYDNILDLRDRGGRISHDEARRRIAELNNKYGISGEPKFKDYTLPDGKKYRELLFQLPTKTNDLPKIIEVDGKYQVVYADGTPTTPIRNGRPLLYDTLMQAQAAVKEYSKKSETYKSRHWDEPNVFAHVRFNERTDVDGNRVLFMEEIQSDWHQEGRKKGYKDSEMLPDGYEIRETDGFFILDSKEYGKEKVKVSKDISNAKEVFLRSAWDFIGAVPDAPFRKNWHEFVLKRMLRYAAENGYDKIAWTSGAMQNERYNLGEKVSKIKYSKNSEKIFGDSAKGKINITIYLKNNPDIAYINELKSKEELENLIGQEITQRIFNGPEYGELTGDDLWIGGKGMKGFYDKIIPDFLNQYGKRWRAKVEPTEIKVVDNLTGASNFKAQSLPITESMNESVIYEGQPLFMRNKKSDGKDNLTSPLPWELPPASGSNTSGKAKRASEIIAEFEKRFLNKVKNGRIKRANVLGYFKIRTHTIRLRKANDIPTFSHEAGHLIDKLYSLSSDNTVQASGLSTNKVHDELTRLGKQTTQSQNRMTIRKEGIAEFLRLYLTDPAQAFARAPETFEYFKKVVDDDLLNFLAARQQEISDLVNLSPEDRVMKDVVDRGEIKPDSSFKQKLGSLYADWIDENYPLYKDALELGGKEGEKRIKEVVASNRGYESSAMFSINPDGNKHMHQTDLYGNNVGPSLYQIMEPLSGDKKKAEYFWKSYAVARRAEDYHNRNMSNNEF